jgi:hypothetical protein
MSVASPHDEITRLTRIEPAWDVLEIITIK